MNPYEALANAIIVQAAKDYRAALRVNNEGKAGEVERFFRSKWFGCLTEIDPEYLIGKLRKERVAK